MEPTSTAQFYISKYGPEVPRISNPGFSTRAIHIGSEPEPIHGSMSTPIHYTSTYAQISPGVTTSTHEYTRASNPTVDKLTSQVAALENAKFALAFASGCGAMTCVLATLKQGDHVISVDDVYGGTNRLMNRVFAKFGLEVTMSDLSDESTLLSSFRPNTKLLIIETPTNPLLKTFDVQKISRIARERGVVSLVDNTFATPYLQSPLDLGADLVLHSGTKYLGGHSDVISGFVATNNEELYRAIRFNQMSLGPCISPVDAWVLIRSIRTLKPRMEAHCFNAFVLAHFLRDQPRVKRLYFPGLKDSPSHELAKKQMRGFGAMISFELDCEAEKSHKFVKELKVFSLAESLGGVESLVNVPALMTHLSVPKEQRDKLGITDGLIRLSVGIEDIEDLIADLENAFKVLN